MKIAVFWPNWIGDAVMATPAVRALRERFPDASILHVLRPYIAGVLEGAPWGHEVALFDPRGPRNQRLWSVVSRLRREHVELALLLPNSFRSALVAWLGNCRRRIGYSRYGRSCLLTDRFEPDRNERGQLIASPVIDAYNRLVQPLGCNPSYRMELFTTPHDEASADDVWCQAGLARGDAVVCLNPGGAFGTAKHWPTEYFAHLARDIVDGLGCNVLILCGPSERRTARTIVSRSGSPSVHSLADYKPSLGLTKACVRRCDLLITTDSGPRHFAAAFNRPVITLFGPTHIAWTETYYPKAVHIQKQVECGPCQQRVCPLDHRCMKLLTPAEVYGATAAMLGQYGRQVRDTRRRVAG